MRVESKVESFALNETALISSGLVLYGRNCWAWASDVEEFGDNQMYAVIVSGGKQHRVTEGEVLKLEKIEVETGGTVEFDRVLLVANGDDVKVGAPTVEGAKVTAEVVDHGRHEKVRILKFKRRKHHMKKMGHRQWFTEVKITGIKG